MVKLSKGEAIISVGIYISQVERECIQVESDHFRADGSIGLNLVSLCVGPDHFCSDGSMERNLISLSLVRIMLITLERYISERPRSAEETTHGLFEMASFE